MWEKRIINTSIEAECIRKGKSKFIARLLSQRNIPIETIDDFLCPSYNNLCHPYKLQGIKEASEIFCQVALKNGTVMACGDYDADGIFSCSMIKELCNIFNLKCDVFLPSRSDHGYGLNTKSVGDIINRFAPPDLLFILDSGTNSEKEILDLKKWGAKHVVILDHHLVDKDKISKSADVLINWHLCDFQETCACGEVFHLVRGVRWLTKKVDPISFLSYAAVGILADVSPVIGNNRIIVKNGLKQYSLDNVVASGFNALLRKSGIDSQDVSQEDILFKIAPKINAAGRLSKPDLAYYLLTEHDPDIAEDMADDLKGHNDERKKIQKEMEIEATKMVQSNIEKYKHGIMVFKPEWKVGVVGIVASKLVETFSVPSVVICKNGEAFKGSGRSLENINLKEILDGCKHIFEGYGGHPLAAGVHLKPEFLDKANDIFNEACEKYYKVNGYPKDIRYYDVSLSPKLISIKTVSMLLETMYPYCSQFNPEPIFLLKDAIIESPNLKEIGSWKILTFSASKDGEKTSMQFKTFNGGIGTEISGCKADIYFSFPQITEKNRFNQYPTLNVIDFVLK